VLSFPTAKAIDTFHHRSLLNSHKACHHKTSRSPPHLLELVDVAHRGSSFSRSFSSSHSRSLAPAATATANGPPQDPRSYLNLRPLHADCLGTQTKRTTDHFWSTAQSSNNSVKWHRAGPNPPRPTISYALQDYPTLYPFSHRHSLGGSQPTCYSSKARERPSLSLPRTANVMFKPKPLLLADDRSTTFAPGARNREDDVRMMVVVLVVVALAVDPPPWDPRSQISKLPHSESSFRAARERSTNMRI